MNTLFKRQHIQHADNTSILEPHWGYANRILPCTNDKGTCEYLDAVYWMHDTSMLYTFIMWAVIGACLLIAITLRMIKPRATSLEVEGENQRVSSSTFYRVWRGIKASMRRHLLPESLGKVFGNVTRLQLLVLAIICAYLVVFSFVAIVYRTWITPVKANPKLFNTRTGLGGFSDRIGALAYALTPFAVALATRESVLTLATGIPYQSFNFLHRWLGRIIFVQGAVHSFGWVLIEARFYKPQPTVWKNFIKQLYMIWGVVALVLITILYITSLRSVIKLTGYEFFRKVHYVVAMLYIGACWGHWNQLACWMIPSLAIWGIDRGIRLLRTFLIHYGYADGSTGRGFHPAQSSVQYFDDEDGGVVRLDFDHKHKAWSVGQHFFLCFPALTIWQSHPLTVASLPTSPSEVPHHAYIIRCRKGETGRLKTLALSQLQSMNQSKESALLTTPVILTGPYGSSLLPTPEPTNLLLIAGGTGISLTLPVALASTTNLNGPAIDFIWIIRRACNTSWIASELSNLKSRAPNTNLNIHIYVTQEASASASAPASPQIAPITEKGIEAEVQALSSSALSLTDSLSTTSSFDITYLNSAKPSLRSIVEEFMESRAVTAYRTRVIASGPPSMGRDLRSVVAKCNDGTRVAKGERAWDVDLSWDDRMG